MKKIALYFTVSTLAVLSIWLFLPDNSNQINTHFVKSDSVAFPSFTDLKPSVDPIDETVDTKAVKQVTPPSSAKVSDPAAKITHSTPVITVGAKVEVSSYRFEDMYAVFLRHLTEGVSQTELMRMRTQALAAELPVAWMFASVLNSQSDDDPSKEAVGRIHERYLNNFFTVPAAPIRIRLSTDGYKHHINLFKDQVLACERCANKELVYFHLSAVFDFPRGRVSSEFSEHYPLFPAANDLTHLFVNQTNESTDLEHQKVQQDYAKQARLLANAGNKLMRQEGEFYLALLEGNMAQITEYVKQSEDFDLMDYIFVQKLIHPSPHDALYQFLLNKTNQELSEQNIQTLADFALYHGAYYNLSEAVNLMHSVTAKFPKAQQWVQVLTIKRAHELGFSTLSEKWQQEYEQHLVNRDKKYDGRKDRKISRQKMLRTFRAQIFGMFDNRGEKFLSRWSRKFISNEYASELLISEINWPSVLEEKFLANTGGIQYFWNTGLSKLNQLGVEHNIDANINNYVSMLLSSFDRNNGSKAEILYIYPQLLPLEKQRFIAQLRHSDLDSAKALLAQLNSL